jgi:hypothetical protein
MASDCRASSILLIVCAAVLTLACVGKDKRKRVPLGASDTTVIALEAQQAAPLASLVEEMRIDATADDLAPIRLVLVRPDSTLVVDQRFDGQLRLYNHSGTLVAKVGSKGEGPEDLRSIRRMGLLGDSVWVQEVSAGSDRIAFVSPDFKIVYKKRLPFVFPSVADVGRYPFSFSAYIQSVAPDGTYIASSLDGFLAPPDYRKDGIPILLVNRFGFIQRTIGRMPVSGTPLVSFSIPDVGGCSFAVPFSHEGNHAFSPDGGALAAYTPSQVDGAATLTVVALRTDGDTLFAKKIEVDPVEIPKARRDSALIARVEDIRSERQSCTRFETQYVARYEAHARKAMPDFYDPAVGIRIGNDGITWIQLRRVADRRPWLMLDGRGMPVGRVLLPRNQELVASNGDQLWVLESDEDGLQSVVRLRMIAGAPDAAR